MLFVAVTIPLARFTDSEWFIIEGDEYDTAFFDKRSKFVHYHAKTAILNNLEYDHADIFADLAPKDIRELMRLLAKTKASAQKSAQARAV